MDLFKKCTEYNKTVLGAIKGSGLYPYFHYLKSGQNTEVDMEGNRTIMIGSNNYLGLTSNEAVKTAGIEAIKKYGTGCSGSRFLNGTLDIHIELEKELAAFLHKEDVVTFSTGFQSNLGIISAIVGRNDYVVCDKENHASIYDACRLSYGKMVRFEHADMADLERQLKQIKENDKQTGADHGILIVTDGVFSMGGDIANLPVICKLARQYDARVMVDDAHGLGVLGAHGRGTAEYFGLEDQVDIYMGTFSKSLASLGGYMASTKDAIDYVRHNSRPFIFSASITPASVACARASLKLLSENPKMVQNLSDIATFYRNELKKRGVKIIEKDKTPIIPIYVYEDEKAFMACRMLLDRGVYVNPVVSPATPKGQALLRTSCMATHTKAQMTEAAEKIAEVLRELKVITD